MFIYHIKSWIWYDSHSYSYQHKNTHFRWLRGGWLIAWPCHRQAVWLWAGDSAPLSVAWGYPLLRCCIKWDTIWTCLEQAHWPILSSQEALTLMLLLPSLLFRKALWWGAESGPEALQVVLWWRWMEMLRKQMVDRTVRLGEAGNLPWHWRNLFHSELVVIWKG